MRIEPKKIGAFQKFWLRLKFPKIPSKDGNMVTITKGEYKLMKNILDRDYKYLTQIMEQSKEIRELNDLVKEKEEKRRKLASKIGGMQKEINKLRK